MYCIEETCAALTISCTCCKRGPAVQRLCDASCRQTSQECPSRHHQATYHQVTYRLHAERNLTNLQCLSVCEILKTQTGAWKESKVVWQTTFIPYHLRTMNKINSKKWAKHGPNSAGYGRDCPKLAENGRNMRQPRTGG